MTRKILLASVLKPVNDVRMYEKIGISIAGTGKFEVHICGYVSDKLPGHPDVHFHGLADFPRLSWKRLVYPLKVGKTIFKVKPEVIIVNSHELLIVSCFFRILFGSRVIYDVRENYFSNIWHQHNFPSPFKYGLAAYVRAKEWFTRPFISHYLLAERHYAQELGFTRGKFTLVENKFLGTVRQKGKKWEGVHLKLAYTGTISENYGVFEAIQLANEISKYSSVTLTIIGYCANFQLLNTLASKTSILPYVDFRGAGKPVAYSEIRAVMEEADAALTLYHDDPSLNGCIPTKFYEYIALKIPILYPTHNPFWHAFLGSFKAGMPVDSRHFNAEQVLQALRSGDFYPAVSPEAILWASEEAKLLALLDRLLP